MGVKPHAPFRFWGFHSLTRIDRYASLGPMVAARLTPFRAARGLVAGLTVLAVVLLTLSAGAQTPAVPPASSGPSSISVLVDQVRDRFPKVDGDVIEVQDKAVTLSLGK